MAGAVASALGEVRVEDVVRPQVLGVEDGEVVVEDVGVRVVQPEPATPSLLMVVVRAGGRLESSCLRRTAPDVHLSPGHLAVVEQGQEPGFQLVAAVVDVGAV